MRNKPAAKYPMAKISRREVPPPPPCMMYNLSTNTWRLLTTSMIASATILSHPTMSPTQWIYPLAHAPLSNIGIIYSVSI